MEFHPTNPLNPLKPWNPSIPSNPIEVDPNKYPCMVGAINTCNLSSIIKPLTIEKFKVILNKNTNDYYNELKECVCRLKCDSYFSIICEEENNEY